MNSLGKRSILIQYVRQPPGGFLPQVITLLFRQLPVHFLFDKSFLFHDLLCRCHLSSPFLLLPHQEVQYCIINSRKDPCSSFSPRQQGGT